MIIRAISAFIGSFLFSTPYIFIVGYILGSSATYFALNPIVIIALFILFLLSFALLYTSFFAGKFESIIRKISFHYCPSCQEMIYLYSFSISHNFKKGNRSITIGQTNELIDNYITAFQEDLFNAKRHAYASEFNLLRRGKNIFKRMLLFSEEDVADNLSNFGAALANGDDPLAFAYLKQILSQMKKYGKIEGWLKRIATPANQINLLVGLIVTSVTLVISLLNFLLT